MAGQEGLEPPTVGFGDRCSTIGATDLLCERLAYLDFRIKSKKIADSAKSSRILQESSKIPQNPTSAKIIASAIISNKNPAF